MLVTRAVGGMFLVLGLGIAGCHVGGGSSAPPVAGTADEAYAALPENDFREARRQPLSTFALDVDTASYGNTRDLLRRGLLPPQEAVRVEEFVNAFRYGDPAPAGSATFAVRSELAVCPWQPEDWLLRVSLRARDLDGETAPPANLVFLIDVSGSMQDPGKLDLLQRAFTPLLDRLRPTDRVAVCTYASGTEVVLARAGGADRERIAAVVQGLVARGSTNGAGGLELAYRVAADNAFPGCQSRVILCSDGDFNVGRSTPAELRELVAGHRRSGIFLTVLGVGRGNLKDANLEAMADHGNGNYHYLDGMAAAQRLFGGRFVEQTVVARDAKVQVEFNPGLVAAWRLLGYENRALRGDEFRDDRKDGGEVGAGQTVTALYQLRPTAGAFFEGQPLRYRSEPAPPPPGPVAHPDEVAAVQLRWQAPAGGDAQELQHLVRAGLAAPSPDLHLAATAAGFALLLRDSQHRGQLDWPTLRQWTDRLDQQQVPQYELAELVRRAAELRHRTD